jgi:hypothetical protein
MKGKEEMIPLVVQDALRVGPAFLLNGFDYKEVTRLRTCHLQYTANVC